MAITFCHPEVEPCGVVVGMEAGPTDFELGAESFRGIAKVLSITDVGSEAGCDIIFRPRRNFQEVEVWLPASRSLTEHRIEISVAVSPFPALDSIAHAVLAPAFASGVVGVDWDDVCSILRSGKRAVLVMAESDEAVTETLRLAESVLVTGDHARISGVMAVVLAPQGGAWMEAVRQVGRAAENLAPNAWRLLAAPVILGDAPICAVLAVFPE